MWVYIYVYLCILHTHHSQSCYNVINAFTKIVYYKTHIQREKCQENATPNLITNVE